MSAARFALAGVAGALAAVGGQYLQQLEDADHAGASLLHDLQHQALLGVLVAMLVGILLGARSGGRAIALLAVTAAAGFVAGFLLLQMGGAAGFS